MHDFRRLDRSALAQIAVFRMNFSMDLRNYSSSGFSTAAALFWRPTLVQGGLTYSVFNSSLSPTLLGGFQTLNWNFTSASDWLNFENPTLRPDFSAGGSVIYFGYRAQQGGTCPSNFVSCRATSAVDGLDNYRVELAAEQSSGEVPEPSTWALVASSVLLAAKYRNRGETRKDGAAA